ncbi:energy-coupling factor transporter transmembrane component T family protein [Thermoactinomyces mirandus]|uniref:Energy-coupling factor transporter transmembrane protein EcfT n=1 Tax=Thermoactinomyces mirandus TaxID=2756294 RepID=A0A7W2AT64_9BACL|nr:energy-coupling factor transporter transmembrane component T [Thermoactinomyces mirandus]MBA4603201.1 energy-coupling factor transporter transmembrane protein EcfT [Thermoactinomyces mirandus]
MNGFIVGMYLPGDSFVHQLDPRAKLGFAFIFMFMVFFADRLLACAIFLAFVLVAIHIAKVPYRLFFTALKPIIFIILLSSLLHLWMTKGGEMILAFPGITIYEEGIRQAGIISIRLLLLVAIASLLTFTTSPVDLTDGMESLLSPLRKIGVPAHELALMMSIALRFIPTLWEETEKIRKAQMARGIDFEEGHILKRLKKHLPILIPLFISAFRRAEDLALAMEARCYRGSEGRTKWRQLHYTRRDLWLLLILILLGMVLLIFRH